MNVYKRLDVCEGVPVQYVGVYVTKWRPEWGQPTAMFVEDDDPVRAAYDAQVARIATLTAQRDAALEACEALIEWRNGCADLPTDIALISAYQRAISAIAKARGEVTP